MRCSGRSRTAPSVCCAIGAPTIRQRAPVLLPDRGGRDCNQADLGRPEVEFTGAPLLDPPGKSERGIQPRSDAACAETRYGRRQDDGHGHIDCLAHGERSAAGQKWASKGFLIVAPGITIKDRLRVLTPEEHEALKGDELAEAKEANEAAGLWNSGIEAVKRELWLAMVHDHSATLFFLRGSEYREGPLFDWVMRDFSLIDAIECSIVKLPRVPIMENVTGGDTPMFRNRWEHVDKHLSKKGRASVQTNKKGRPTL